MPLETMRTRPLAAKHPRLGQGVTMVEHEPSISTYQATGPLACSPRTSRLRTSNGCGRKYPQCALSFPWLTDSSSAPVISGAKCLGSITIGTSLESVDCRPLLKSAQGMRRCFGAAQEDVIYQI